MKKTPLVSIIMGSDSDLPIVEKAFKMLEKLEIVCDGAVLSAHRTPTAVKKYIEESEALGVKVFIGAAGKAAHLPGVIASYTTKPVIGLPIKSSSLDGMDSLLSIVQMPSGIPVATVAIDGAENAALLAAQILAISDEKLAQKLVDIRKANEEAILEKNKLFKWRCI